MDVIAILDKIREISHENNDKMAPVEILRRFTKGKSGALVYLVEYGEDNKVGILKISKDNESKAYAKAYEIATSNNMHKYIAKIIANYEIKGVEKKTVYANIYDLAGDDIYNMETFLDKVINEDELKDSIISKLTKFIFTWNKDHIKKLLSPQDIIKGELSYRYMDEKYVQALKSIGVRDDIKWISIDGTDLILPNPYYYFNNKDVWQGMKTTCLTSFAHGDFQGNNIIITEQKPIIIDFCDIVEECNIFHDLRYLEAITVGDYLELERKNDKELWIKVCESLSEGIMEVDFPRGRGMTLLRSLIPMLRENLKIVVSDSRNTLYNPSFYLSGVACGLINMRKFEDITKKKSAFIYAAFNLKQFLKDESINMYDPQLSSCMTLSWINESEGNKLVKLE